MRRLPAGFAASVLLTIVVVSPTPASAQVVGDRVAPRRAIELKVKDQVMAKAGPEETLTVEKTQDDWLWVATAAGVHGWVLKEDVKPAQSPAAPPARAEPSQAPANPQDDANIDDRLYLIGAMGATQVYLTYSYIGAIGDSYVHKTIEAAKVQDLMSEVDGMGDHLVKNLKEVRDGDLTEEDRAAIDQMIAINEMLQTQAQALSAFSADPTPENAQTFDSIRMRVWPLISNLLEIRPTKGVDKAAGAESSSAESAPRP
jgi:hypothetical protein